MPKISSKQVISIQFITSFYFGTKSYSKLVNKEIDANQPFLIKKNGDYFTITSDLHYYEVHTNLVIAEYLI